jgi:hypothetical protein
MILNYPVAAAFIDAVSQSMITQDINNPYKVSGTLYIYLCVGDFPTDSVIKALSDYNDAYITSKTTSIISITGQPISQKIDDHSYTYMYDMSTSSPGSACSIAGTISWAVVRTASYTGGTNQWGIVDVGLLNSGCALTLDKTTVLVGDTPKAWDLTYRIGVNNA